MMKQDISTQDGWIVHAAFCELLAVSLQLPTSELVATLVSGEFGEALGEVGERVGLEVPLLARADSLLCGYVGQEADELFHLLRTEYTRLFVGAPEPVVSPYAGVWYARRQGVEPLLFVSTRAMEIERFMRHYGIGQAEGKNEPLDHIATEFEFLQYVALANAGAVQMPEGIEMSTQVFDTFLSRYVADWSEDFANSIAASSECAFYQTIADVLKGMGPS
jgi:TorA maturation chaperone TorD